MGKSENRGRTGAISLLQYPFVHRSPCAHGGKSTPQRPASIKPSVTVQVAYNIIMINTTTMSCFIRILLVFIYFESVSFMFLLAASNTAPNNDCFCGGSSFLSSNPSV